MQEQTRAERWLYSTLAGDSALVGFLPTDPDDGAPAIYEAPGPQPGVWPRVTYFFASGQDTRVIGVGPRILTELQFQVKVIGKTASILDLEAIADRVDALLDGVTGGPTTGGGHVASSTRTSGFVYPEVTDGVSFRHLGGIYRLVLLQG